jgi:multicomponent Na+:H+ antiporter subunit E
MNGRWLPRLLAVIWLTIVWCAVIGSMSVGSIVAGAAVGTALVFAFPTPEGALAGTRVRPWALVAMNAHLFVQLVRANLQVAWAVISPSRAGLRRAIVAVPLVPSTDLVLHLLLNAVSLTPGTLILEVRREPAVLYIHLLQFRSEAAIHLEVLRTQRLFVAALGPADALRAIDDRIAVLTDIERADTPMSDLPEEAP